MIRRGLFMSLLPLALTAGAGLWGYLTVEPGVRVPVHWGLDGRPDRFAGPAEAFLSPLALAAGVTLLFAGLPRLDPRGSNLRHSVRAYLVAWLGTLWLLALLQVGTVLTATGILGTKAGGLQPRLTLAGAALIIVLVGNYLGKTRPNWILGVRTPWTLSSDLAWERTHRLAGRLFVAVGIVGAITSVVEPAAGVSVLIAGVLTAALASVVYSYLVWRQAPDKQVGSQIAD